MHFLVARSPQDFYGWLDRTFSEVAGGDPGFGNLLAAAPRVLDEATLQGFSERYDCIRRFQQTTLGLFLASLKGEAHPEIAAHVLGDVPAAYGADYHRGLSPAQLKVPLFFRTDEPVIGKLSEIQCPGSGWAGHDLIEALYRAHEGLFDGPRVFHRSLAQAFAEDLREHLGVEPIVHHLFDNASQPQEARYFIQRTREHGVRYFSWDPGVHSRDCNFVRSHDWISLLHDNFHRDRLLACDEKRLSYDLSPCALFDAKAILALPFDPQTRDHYDDDIRAMIPYTQVFREDGILLSDGSWAGPEDIINDSKLRRRFYAKYAGTDVNLNWGSRAVFYLGEQSRVHARSILERIITDARRGRHWILQAVHRQKSAAPFYTREGELQESRGYEKLSAFYGPKGLMGIMAFHRRAAKVHGSADTIMSVVR